MTIQDKIRKLLKFLIPILNKHNIEYWIDCGTLLGIIRDGDVIEWDSDGDISFLYSLEQFKELTYALFWNTDKTKSCILKGYGIRPEVFYGNIPTRDEPWIDFYGWKDVGNTRFVSIEQGFLKSICPYKSHIGKRKEIIWQGIKVMIPEFPEQRLTQLYGKWKIPKNKVPYWK